MERLAGLKSEVDAIRRKLEPLKKEEPSLMQEIATNKAMLRDLRTSLRDVEAEVSAVDGRLQLESQSRHRQRGEEHNQWEEKLATALKHLKDLRSHHEQALQEAQSSLRVSRLTCPTKTETYSNTCSNTQIRFFLLFLDSC